MTDIAGRLAKLSKWDELAKRAQMERSGSPPGAPFAEVIVAAGRIVRRYPGMAVVLMLDGSGEAVRIAEKDGDFSVEPIAVTEPSRPEDAQQSPGDHRRDRSTAGPTPRPGHPPERLTSNLAALLRRNPGLMSGWPSRRDTDEHP